MLIRGILMLAATALFVAGCSGEKEYKKYSEADEAESHDAHAHEAPHGGHVIELGDHEYHAEVVFDNETRQITVYIYDGELENPVAIDPNGLVFDIETDDDELELPAKAQPVDSDAEGKTSRFVIAGTDVPEAYDDIEKIHGHVHVTINGTEYEGELHDDHDGEDHHAEGEDEDHEKDKE